MNQITDLIKRSISYSFDFALKVSFCKVAIFKQT